jgi:hypothetical protein
MASWRTGMGRLAWGPVELSASLRINRRWFLVASGTAALARARIRTLGFALAADAHSFSQGASPC